MPRGVGKTADSGQGRTGHVAPGMGYGIGMQPLCCHGRQCYLLEGTGRWRGRVCWSKLGRIKGPKRAVDRWGTRLVFSTCQTQAHRADTWKHAEQASNVAAQSAAVAVEAFSFLPDLSGLPTQSKHFGTVPPSRYKSTATYLQCMVPLLIMLLQVGGPCGRTINE